MNPYCFVITSFDKKQDIKDLQKKFDAKDVNTPARKIDFDKIYEGLVKPAIIQAGMEPLIEKEENSLGSIHKTMYEKILLCEFCVADLTNANPNAYYEIGMRYAVKPHTTIPIIASSHFPLPFDVGTNRTFTYQVDDDFNLNDKEGDVNKLATLLIQAKRNRSTDSPLYDMVNGIEFQNAVAHEKTDVFRDNVKYNEKLKEELKYARTIMDEKNPDKIDKEKSIAAIDAFVKDHQPLDGVETAVLIDVMISYRNIEAFTQMQQFIEMLPQYVFNTVMVQEQYAFILNRNGGKQKPVDEVMINKAEDILKKLESESKASSETYGIWGRIYKDKFDRLYAAGKTGEAKAQLKSALKYYQKGFEADIRDAYPGVNYVTCLELLGDKDTALRMAPAVEVAVKTKMKRKEPDYWDYATLIELAVIENKYDTVEDLFYSAKSLAVESWMFGTTLGNLQKILTFRKERNENITELKKILDLFEAKD